MADIAVRARVPRDVVDGISIPGSVASIENRFIFAGSMSGAGASPKIAQYIAVAQTIPANFAGSGSRALTAATSASNVFTLKYVRSGSTNTIGTVTYSNADVTTLSTQAAFSLLVGDVLFLEGPVTPDATLADWAFTLLTSRT